MKLQLSLEWFLNPDHLPLIAGIELGWYREAGLELELLVPDDHYDGLAETVAGKVAFACNEPLHMIDAHRPGLKALGCFFETDGGILLQRAAGERLLQGETVRLASPVAGGVTDAIAVEILSRWCRPEAPPEPAQVRIGGWFRTPDNLRAGLTVPGCAANFEGEAEAGAMRTSSPPARWAWPISRRWLFTSEDFLARHGEVVATVVDLVGRGASLCRDNPAEAAELWYRYSGTQPTELMDAIIADTCPRLVGPVRRDQARWQGMWEQFDRMGLSQVDREGYAALYS